MFAIPAQAAPTLSHDELRTMRKKLTGLEHCYPEDRMALKLVFIILEHALFAQRQKCADELAEQNVQKDFEEVDKAYLRFNSLANEYSLVSEEEFNKAKLAALFYLDKIYNL
jgi:hypothetical protein